KFVVDASGGASVIGRQVANRKYDDRMRQVAFHTYYEDVVGPNNHRDGHVIVMSCSKGWFWYIPVDSKDLGAASVGLVSGQEFKDEYNEKGTEAFFEEALQEVEYLQELLGPKAKRTQPMSAITDWSYACDKVSGPGWYLAGDAAAFLDPLLSTGVTMAMLAGYSASACIHTSLQNESRDAAATEFYDSNYQRMWTVTRDFLHYFYAGNHSAHPDEIFWEARSRLCLNENIGAQQAFCFMVNTIPGNPHPALEKQIHMFQQFMDNMEHPMEDMSCEFMEQHVSTKEILDLEELNDSVIPTVNGDLATSWTIDKEGHCLVPVRGVAYDQSRAVFSSTSSWLLGRNIYPLPDSQCDLLELFNGQSSWGEVVERHASKAGKDAQSARDELTPLLRSLYEERFVLLRGESAHA
ncbi:MAG: tryptophan 7-halogenase, partial [Myxococcota bacterium]|nr:tryptophan 7-halogenase [Myxococcota bacterium]